VTAATVAAFPSAFKSRGAALGFLGFSSSLSSLSSKTFFGLAFGINASGTGSSSFGIIGSGLDSSTTLGGSSTTFGSSLTGSGFGLRTALFACWKIALGLKGILGLAGFLSSSSLSELSDFFFRALGTRGAN
jgi:hypothetical protein